MLAPDAQAQVLGFGFDPAWCYSQRVSRLGAGGCGWCVYWCVVPRTLCYYTHARASPQLQWCQHCGLLKCTGTATVSPADCPAVWPGDASLHCALRP